MPQTPGNEFMVLGETMGLHGQQSNTTAETRMASEGPVTRSHAYLQERRPLSGKGSQHGKLKAVNP